LDIANSSSESLLSKPGIRVIIIDDNNEDVTDFYSNYHSIAPAAAACGIPMNTDNTAEHIGDRFFDAIERSDYDSILHRIYSNDAVIWHNTDNINQTAVQNVDSLRSVAAIVSEWRYKVIRRIEYAGGFFQQYQVHLIPRNGKRFVLHVCGAFDVRDGKISRLEEYYDAASLGAVFKASEEE
jgi:ketosteroid isomerase-like protein